MPTTQALSPLDATFLELEELDDGSTMHIGGCLVFEALPDRETGAPTLEELAGLLETRLSGLPLFSCRIDKVRTGGLDHPSWIRCELFDPREHLVHGALPKPGGKAELDDWLGDFWSHRLDRTRPLWEMALVEGLEGGRWALVTKTHHALVDGVSSVDVGHVLLDVTREGRDEVPAAEVPDGPVAPSGTPLVLRAPRFALRAARGVADHVVHPERALQLAKDGVALAKVVWEDEVNAARPSSLNVPIGPTRRFTAVELELAEVKRIKAALGGTVNDVVLAVCAGGLRAMLDARGDALDAPMRAMVPVDIRADAEHGDLGNKVTSLFVDLPVGVEDATERYARTMEAAEALKASDAARGGSAIIGLAGLLPPLAHRPVSKALYAHRLFNVTITNVPGPQFPLYAFGARLEEIHPLVPLFDHHAVGLAIVSYDGRLFVGCNADKGVVGDLDVLADGLRRSYHELAALA